MKTKMGTRLVTKGARDGKGYIDYVECLGRKVDLVRY